MNKLLIRACSGAIYVVLIVGAIVLGNAWFASLLTIVAILATIEFENILDHGKPQGWAAWCSRVLDVVVAIAIVNLANIFVLPDWLLISFLLATMLYTLARFTLALYDRNPRAFSATAWSILSQIYIAMPLALLVAVYSDRGAASAWLVLAMFVMIWLNDTGAFLVGSTFGRHRLFERLSPKKSWEGFFGGFVFCLIAGAACHYLLPEITFGLAGWIGFGAMVSVLSTWGDLFESLMKRTEGIKDSGKLIPGHGGILDRIDSLLFVSIGTFVLYNVLL